MLDAQMKGLAARFEGYAEEAFAGFAWPDRLLSAARHAFFGGGKRVRPVLALLAAEAVSGLAGPALPWALAIELIHTYSLVHDDLPAMDDDDERRGRPTCHKAFDEATAILAGDALLTEAFAVAARASDAVTAERLVVLLARAAGGAGMVAGQVADIGGVADAAALEAMQRLKTGALITAAAEGAAIAVGGEPEEVAAIRAGARELGLLFQITDDLLDAEQDAEPDGRSYLHHFSRAEVQARLDATAAAARAAFGALGSRAALLVAFVDRIAHRTV
ncbi:MAG: polyprenyl synthetase family protein [bacterium]